MFCPQITEFEDEDITVLATLKSSLLDIMAKLLMSLPLETLKGIPTYDTTEHEKAVNAYSKIINCLKNYKELQKKNLSSYEATPQSCANISPLCLSPNDKHYRLLHRRENEKSFDRDLSFRPEPHRVKEAGPKASPVLSTKAFDSLGNSFCKKLFESPSVSSKKEVNAQAQQPCTENIPSSSKNIPNVSKFSEDTNSAAKCMVTEPPQTDGSGTFKTPQAPPHRKFSFGKHRELESSSDKSPSPGNGNIFGLKAISTKPTFSPSDTSRAVTASASVYEGSSNSGTSTVKSLPSSSDQLGLKTINTKPIFSSCNTPGAVNASASVYGGSSNCGTSTVKSLPNTSNHSGVTQPVGKASGFLVRPQPKNSSFGK